jgi:hypothetical protein
MFNIEQTDGHRFPTVKAIVGGACQTILQFHGDKAGRRLLMICPSCQSHNQAEFTAEMIVHLPGPENLDQPGVWLFPKLSVCLNCGVSRFTIPQPSKLLLLTSDVRKADSSAQRERFQDIAL